MFVNTLFFLREREFALIYFVEYCKLEISLVHIYYL